MPGFTMTAAAVWMSALAFVAVSMFLNFSPKLRVFAGLIVGSGLSAAASGWIIAATVTVSGRIAAGVDGMSAYEAAALAAATPTIIAAVCGVIVWKFFRGGGGRSHSGYGRRSGGGQIPPGVALAAAVVLPVLVPPIGAAIGGAFA
jgi:hypothetical protein